MVSSELKAILQLIADDFRLFQAEFEDALRSEIRLINVIGRYLIRHKGKGIRPILTLLSARVSGTPTMNSYRAAAMVELLHLATLMHDDVIDGAHRRRGFPTIHRLWKSKTAVIMGDYVLSKVLENLIRLRQFDALDVLARTADRLSTGEMLQLEKSFRKDMTEDVYYRMIRNKTASLMGAACELGAITSGGGDQGRQALAGFGENFGMAFQIRDDLFDFGGASASSGKDSHSDVVQNIVTLPLIRALHTTDRPGEIRKIQKRLRNGSSGKDLRRLSALVEERGGFEYARQKIRDFSSAAVDALSVFPDTPHRAALIDLTLFNASRAY